MNITSRLLATALVLPLYAAPALAQQTPQQQTPQQPAAAGSEGTSAGGAGPCQGAVASHAPSQPQSGPSSGTAPNNPGSTAWSGAGLGGSHTGTTPSKAVPSSPQDDQQHAVATGLDLGGTSAKPAQKC